MGMKPEWEAISGDWRIANGRLTSIARGQFSYVFAGEPTAKNYAIDVDFDAGSRGMLSRRPIAIIMNAQDVNNMITFELELDYSTLKLRKNGRWVDLIDGYRMYGHLPSDYRGHLRVEVRDNFFTVYIDGELWLSMNDNTFSGGRVGVGMSCADKCPGFDDFRVTELD